MAPKKGFDEASPSQRKGEGSQSFLRSSGVPQPVPSLDSLAEMLTGLSVGGLADLKGLLPPEVVSILSAGARSLPFPPGGALAGAVQGAPGDPKGTTRRTALRKARKQFKETAGNPAAHLAAFERFKSLCQRFGRRTPDTPEQLQEWLDVGFGSEPEGVP